MTITLFYSPFCPPARTVLLVAKALKLPVKIEQVDLLSTRYKQCSFKKQHPEKTIPCLKDDNHFIWDSHAISDYLLNKYGQRSKLRPKNFIQKAHVQRLIHFESEKLLPLTFNAITPIVFRGKSVISNTLVKSISKTYSILDRELLNYDWLTGNSPSIADLCCISSLSTLDLIVPVEENSNLFFYMQQFKELPYYQEGNLDGLNIVAGVLLDKIVKSRFGTKVCKNL